MADESKYPTRIAPYGLRMPPELKEQVQASADANNRSMNAEIVARLEATFSRKALELSGLSTRQDGLEHTFVEISGRLERVEQVLATLKQMPPRNSSD